MRIPVSMTVNGRVVTAKVEGRMLLTQFLREHLRLTGTHIGCDTGQCGACTVHLNGRAVKSCTLLALQAQGAESNYDRGDLRRRWDAAPDASGLQGAPRPAVRILHPGHGHEPLIDLAQEHAEPDRSRRSRGPGRQLCRCTGYQNIVKAVLEPGGCPGTDGRVRTI